MQIKSKLHFIVLIIFVLDKKSKRTGYTLDLTNASAYSKICTSST